MSASLSTQLLISSPPFSLPVTSPHTPSLLKGGLQYFENLRMARIFNATYSDPDSIQIDIDELIENYSSVMGRILRHVGILAPQPNYYDILGVS